MKLTLGIASLLLSLLLVAADEPAKQPPAKEPPKEGTKEPAKQPEYAVPDLRELITRPESEIAAAVRRYETDRATLLRTHPVPTSPAGRARLARYYQSWRTALERLDPGKLTLISRLEYQFLQMAVKNELR